MTWSDLSSCSEHGNLAAAEGGHHVWVWILHSPRLEDEVVLFGAKNKETNTRFIALRPESPSGNCAKLHTVAASNNRDRSMSPPVTTFNRSHATVATSALALRRMCDSPRTESPRTEMCAKNNNIYAWREQAIIRDIVAYDLYCYLLSRCEALRTCRSGFRSQQWLLSIKSHRWGDE